MDVTDSGVFHIAITMPMAMEKTVPVPWPTTAGENPLTCSTKRSITTTSEQIVAVAQVSFTCLTYFNGLNLYI